MEKSMGLVIDTNLLKNIQTNVNRRLESRRMKIQLAEVREYVYQNYPEMTNSEKSQCIDELVLQVIGQQPKELALRDGLEDNVRVPGQSSALSLPNKKNEVENERLSSNIQPFNQPSIPGELEIYQAVQQEFASESLQMQGEIVRYLSDQTFNNAIELREKLTELRKFRIDVLRKLINDHNQQSNQDLHSLKQALSLGSVRATEESVSLANDFLSDLQTKRAVFGL